MSSSASLVTDDETIVTGLGRLGSELDADAQLVQTQMKREAGGQDFRVNFRVNFRSAGRPAGMSRHNQQRSLLKKAARSWEAPMRRKV